jgi:hypothetical protein
MCTSTPTRNKNAKTLSSTPNTSTHNAYDHHPSRTIRRKHQHLDASPQPKTSIIMKKSYCKHLCPYHENHHRHHHHHHHHHHHMLRNPCTILKKNETRQQSLTNKKNIKLKTSNFEISLQDLLYTPMYDQAEYNQESSQDLIKKRKIYFI